MEMQIEPSVIAATVIDRSPRDAALHFRLSCLQFRRQNSKGSLPRKATFYAVHIPTDPQTIQHAQSNDAQGGAPGKERKSAACVGARSPSFTHPAPNLKTSPVLALLF